MGKENDRYHRISRKVGSIYNKINEFNLFVKEK